MIPIFHTGRCGSTVLSELIQNTRGLRSKGEIISVNYRNLLKGEPNISAKDFFSEQIARWENTHKEITFFEIKYLSTVDMKYFPGGIEYFLNLCAALGMQKAVVLDRRNGLRRIVSTLVALKRGKYQARGNEKVEALRIRVPIRSIWLMRGISLSETLDALEFEHKHLLTRLRALDFEVLQLSYEEHIQLDPLRAHAAVCNFVEVDTGTAKTDLRRINTFPLSEVIENYDQVVEAIRGTRHSWMLEDY